ncbi:hypothetical protein [Cytobacillus praedii]|uniref:hypothetical protein n=1 Tax=Cytobacillus praedii TaxID=1742358 RepID=UPI002E1A6174|nr:hypothetical protein [Cytobacillus praedii]
MIEKKKCCFHWQRKYCRLGEGGAWKAASLIEHFDNCSNKLIGVRKSQLDIDYGESSD